VSSNLTAPTIFPTFRGERFTVAFRSHVADGAALRMSVELKSFLQRWAVCTVAALVATYVVPGIEYGKWPDLLIATFLLGLLNTFLRPLLLLLSLPLLVFTLGLFMLIINAVLLLAVSVLMGDHFRVAGFWPAFWGALVISVVSLLLNSLTGSGNARLHISRSQGRSKPKDDDGPVIDV
jgi:putative membrane protein